MRAVIWLTQGTWAACVDAAWLLPAGTSITLLHVIDPEVVEAVDAARAGLLGRAGRRRPAVGPAHPPAARLEHQAEAEAEARILAAARERLARPASVQSRRGRPEREVVAACADAGVLILARDGDHTRLGPRSLGHATRFVLDHAPCRVLLVWPDDPPELETLPPHPAP